MEELLKLKHSAEDGPANAQNYQVAVLCSLLTGEPVHDGFFDECRNEMDCNALYAGIQSSLNNTQLACDGRSC
jgi:hypothetical protein